MVLDKMILSVEDRALKDNASSLKGWISVSHAHNSPDPNPQDYSIRNVAASIPDKIS